MDVIHNNFATFVEDGGPWHVKYTAPSYLPGSFFDETCKALQMMWEQRKGRVYVLSGGGLDSEYLLRVMAHLKMEAVPVVIKYTDYNNQEIVNRVARVSGSLGWGHYTFEMALNPFISDAVTFHLASITQCSDYRLLPLFHAASRLDGTVLACVSSPPYIGFDSKLRAFVVKEFQQLRSAARGWQLSGVHGTPFALSYTAEQFFSFLDETVTVNYTSERYPSIKNMEDIKSSIYNQTNHFQIHLRTRLNQFEWYKQPFSVKQIGDLGYNEVGVYEYHKLKSFLRAQIP